jgi:hypothetical protein
VSCANPSPDAKDHLGAPILCWHSEKHRGMHGNMNHEWANEEPTPIAVVAVDNAPSGYTFEGN